MTRHCWVTFRRGSKHTGPNQDKTKVIHSKKTYSVSLKEPLTFVWHLFCSVSRRAIHTMKTNKMEWHSLLHLGQTIPKNSKTHRHIGLWHPALKSRGGVMKCSRQRSKGSSFTSDNKRLLMLHDTADRIWWEKASVKFTLGDNERSIRPIYQPDDEVLLNISLPV